MSILPTADYKDVRIVGIPRALLFYRYGVFWTTFFEALGRVVLYSEETDRAIVEKGTARSVDECCLASKTYMGHVESLIYKCDAVFVPCYASFDPRCGFCTKFQSLPDLVYNSFRDTPLRIITCLVENIHKRSSVEKGFRELATRLGVTPVEANRAIKAAFAAQEKHDSELFEAQEQALKEIEGVKRLAKRAKQATVTKADVPLTILFVAHPYIAHDRYLGGTVIETLENMGVHVLYADETRRDKTFKESFGFSDTIPWVINRELIGSILLLQKKIDGIVLVSAFPCGPDSMTDDAVMRCIQGTPILNLMIDAQSGTAGIETRVESFVDILRYQQWGGYHA